MVGPAGVAVESGEANGDDVERGNTEIARPDDTSDAVLNTSKQASVNAKKKECLRIAIVKSEIKQRQKNDRKCLSK